MRIDAHQHLWTAGYQWLAGKPEFAPIRREYTVDDLRGRLRDADVSHTVLVEAGACTEAETQRFLRTAAATTEIAGVVGWMSLTDPDPAGTLDRYLAGRHATYLVGIRDQVQGQDDPEYLDRADVRATLAEIGTRGLVCDMVVRVDQLAACARVAADCPQTMFVLDHLGKPRVAAGEAGLRQWRAAVAPLAELPNVVAKVSGLVTEADWARWTIDDLRPFVAAAVELFGTRRLMFGSDWPVCELAATYRRVTDALLDLLGGEDDDVFCHTAIRTYGLEIH